MVSRETSCRSFRSKLNLHRLKRDGIRMDFSYSLGSGDFPGILSGFIMVNDLTQTFTLANEFKEGDLLVGGTRDEQVRKEARESLASLQLGEIAKATFVEDQVTEVLAGPIDSELSNELSRLTVGEVKNMLLAPNGAAWARRYRDGLTSEAIAAVAKLMTNDELGSASRSLFNPLPGDGIAIGSRRHFGSR